jgi:hypothetical protein
MLFDIVAGMFENGGGGGGGNVLKAKMASDGTGLGKGREAMGGGSRVLFRKRRHHHAWRKRDQQLGSQHVEEHMKVRRVLAGTLTHARC